MSYRTIRRIALLASLAVGIAVAQTGVPVVRTDEGAAAKPLSWTPFGNQLVLAGVAGYASGPVDRVWHGAEGAFIQLEDGGIFHTADFSVWRPAPDEIPPTSLDPPQDTRPPGDAWLVRAHPMQPALVYALGEQVYRSIDAGRTFVGLTRYRGVSLLGDSLRDLSLNPLDPEDLLVASGLGLWRSRDGGLSWFPAAAEGLDNFPLARLAAFPEGRRGLVVAQPDGTLLEWVPGAVTGWKRLSGNQAAAWSFPLARTPLARSLSAWQRSGSQMYAGLRDGRLLATRDGGESWRDFTLPGWGAIQQIAVNPSDDQVAIALARGEGGGTLLLRTLNGGLFWEDLTPLTVTSAEAVAADWEQNSLFIAADGQLHWLAFDFRAMARPALLRSFSWEGARGAVRDLRLDPSGTMLFAVTDRAGVYFASLPVAQTSRVRRAADLSSGPIAPGDLLSIHGSPLVTLRADGRESALLGPGDQSTQVQLPYGPVQDRVLLELETHTGASSAFTIAARRVSPAIFLHPDGSPFVLHANTGALVDENYPAAPGERIHVLLSGLGAIAPDWPAGLPAPADAPPAVVAPVEAQINGVRVPVRQATLAPGYAGIYLVELVLPNVMDEGLSDLRVFADGAASNLVALHIAYP